MTKVMSEYDIQLATWGHVAHVIGHLRDVDRMEVCGMYGEDANVGVVIRSTYLVSRDTTFVGLADGEPLCVFGVAPPVLLSDVATPWLLGTSKIRMHSRTFLRHSRRIVKAWASMFPLMRNYVDDRNADAIRWLQWVGFQVYSPEPYGPDELPFRLFEKRSCAD